MKVYSCSKIKNNQLPSCLIVLQVCGHVFALRLNVVVLKKTRGRKNKMTKKSYSGLVVLATAVQWQTQRCKGEQKSAAI